MKKRKFLILYLDTGGGHRAAANVLKTLLDVRYPDSETKIVNGFSQKQYLPKLLLVDFYHIAMNFFSSLYSFVYRIGDNRIFVRIAHLLLQNFTIPRMRKIYEEEQPTDIINLHFALESSVRDLKRNYPEINTTTIVLDPFTAHSSWFYDKKAEYFVFSDRVYQYAINRGKIPSNNLKIVPFILNQKYLTQVSDDMLLKKKKKYAVDPKRKIVLITGGGEGLPILINIVNELILRKADYTVLAVCGRNIAAKAYLDILSKNDLPIDLKVFGFINFMDELIKICDCAVIKAGPASLMEVLSSRKPVVICDFIYGQELGNVQFAVDNGFGKFYRKPSEICDAVDYLTSDDKRRAQLEKRLSNIPISFDTGKVVDMLYEKHPAN